MILSAWKNIGIVFTKFVISIYEGFAYCYNLMCNLIANLDSTFNLNFGTIKESVYVLIAVFMLFRITISLLEYLIDPDKVSDKSVGAGKLITRIIISLVLLLSANFLFNFSKRVEKSLLEGDSILFNIFEKEDSGTGGSQVQTKYCNLSGKNITTIDELEDEVLYCIFTGSLESQMKSIIEKISDDSRSIEFLTKDVQSHGIPDIDFFRDNEEYVITAIDDPFIDPISFKQRIYIYFNKSEGTKNEALEGTDGSVVAEKVLAAFSNKPEDIIGSGLLSHVDVENKIAKSVEQEEMRISSFLALIFGICMVVFIIIICIEVVIRQLKLTVLEMLAPIAFVSYMNPNDKILGNWFQKYIGCYLDLFIKLLAINIGTYLITSIDFSVDDTYGGFVFILLYIGVFLFIKTVPNLISDVFGIKNMGGTFKDSMNALKTAAFTGAGAVAGATVGLVSGFGKGVTVSTVFGGLFGGAARGAAGGAKGKVFQGAATQYKRNSQVKQARQEGSNWFDRQFAGLGVNLTKNEDEEIKKAKRKAQVHQSVVDYAEKAKSYVEGELNKGKGDAMGDSKYAKQYRAAKDELARLDAVRNSITRESVAAGISRERIAAGISHEGITDAEYNKRVDDKYNKIVDDEYNKALSSANGEYEKKHHEFYVDYDGQGKGLMDLAVAEFYNTSKDDKLANMKKNAETTFSSYGKELFEDKDGEDKVDVKIWSSVKEGAKLHESIASAFKTQAESIENSKEHLAKQASQNAKKQ